MSQESIVTSMKLVEWLASKVGGLKMRSDGRALTAAVCFGVAQEHHVAMVSLCTLKQPLHASVFALARPLFEGYLRGMWLAHFATDDQVDSYHEGKIPDTASLIAALDKGLPEGQVSNLSILYKRNWKAMCGMTHAGAEHFGKWNQDGVLEPAFTEDDVGRILDFAARIGVLTIAGVATLSDQPDLWREVLQESKARMPPRYEAGADNPPQSAAEAMGI